MKLREVELVRVAYDYQIFSTQKYGGVSRYFYELASNLASISTVDVGVISPVYINAYLKAAPNNIRVMGRRMPPIRRSGGIYSVVNQLLLPPMMKRFQPDVVHETYYSVKRHAPAGSKVVLTVFDMIHERFPDSFPSWDSTSKDKARAVGRADHIICISEQTRLDLIDLLGVDPEKTSVVCLGFSLTMPPVEAKQKNGRPYLLYVGNRGGYKNFETLLRAFAAKSALRREYDLVAFGGGAFTSKELALISELDLHAERIRQIGGDDAVLAGLYRNAALFVYPSRYEGFGIPPLEAMSFDCPVVCSNTSSIPEVVGDAAWFFDPNSIDSVAQAIEHVLDDGDLRRSLIASGQERIKHFSWARCALETLDVYRRVLA